MTANSVSKVARIRDTAKSSSDSIRISGFGPDLQYPGIDTVKKGMEI